MLNISKVDPHLLPRCLRTIVLSRIKITFPNPEQHTRPQHKRTLYCKVTTHQDSHPRLQTGLTLLRILPPIAFDGWSGVFGIRRIVHAIVFCAEWILVRHTNPAELSYPYSAVPLESQCVYCMHTDAQRRSDNLRICVSSAKLLSSPMPYNTVLCHDGGLHESWTKHTVLYTGRSTLYCPTQGLLPESLSVSLFLFVSLLFFPLSLSLSLSLDL